jgi:hypothetical protein
MDMASCLPLLALFCWLFASLAPVHAQSTKCPPSATNVVLSSPAPQYTLVNLTARAQGTGAGLLTFVDINDLGVVLGYVQLSRLPFLWSPPYNRTTFLVLSTLFQLSPSGSVTGLNNKNVICGSDGNGGYLFKDGQLFSFKYPGAIHTQFSAVNDKLQVVGNYMPPTAFPLLGFVFDYASKNFSAIGNITMSNTPSYVPTGINNDGTICGRYQVPCTFSTQTFVMRAGKSMEYVNVSGSFAEVVRISNAGQAVGTTTNGKGFVVSVPRQAPSGPGFPVPLKPFRINAKGVILMTDAGPFYSNNFYIATPAPKSSPPPSHLPGPPPLRSPPRPSPPRPSPR